MRLSPRLFVLSALAVTLAPSAFAVTYGVYDARAMAMGGTSIAVGTPEQGAYYNPALLALRDKDEDTSGDNRFYFPTLVGRGSTTISDVADAIDSNLDVQITNAINAFNASTTTANAAQVAASARDLRSVLNNVANKDLDVDAFVGLSVSSPSIHSGAAFYFGSRVVGSGSSKVTQNDLSLLDEYIDGMDILAGGGSFQAVAAAHPNIVSGTSIVDPNTVLNSTANVSGMAITEWGIALSKETEILNQRIAFGITPKMVRIDAYIDNADFNNGQVAATNSFSSSTATLQSFNADVGVIYTLFDNYHLSWAQKDIVQKTFITNPKTDPDTGLIQRGLQIKTEPRSRAGLSYTGKDLQVGIDMDLKRSLPLSAGSPSQEISMGAEYRLFGNFRLRLGRTQDRTGFHPSSTSGGFGWKYHKFVIDLAYVQSSSSKGGGLQMGWAF